MDEEPNKLLKSQVDSVTKTIERHNQKMGILRHEPCEYIDKELSEKQRPAPQFSEVVAQNEVLQNQVAHPTEENSRLPTKLKQLQKTVVELSAETVGQTVQPSPMNDIHEESDKKGFFTEFALQKKPITATHLPPFHQASGPAHPGKSGPAEYYKTEDGRYGCLKCASSYKYRSHLNQHKKYECGVQAQFQCADCLRKFKLKNHLKRHIVNKSCHNRRNKNCNGAAEYYKTEDGRYGCLKCASSYKYKSHLNQHKKYECGVQAQFQCADCLMKFKQKSHLKTHIVKKRCHNRRNINWRIRNGFAEYYKTEDGRYGCLKCGSSYKHKTHLNRHKKYECGIQAQFQCPDCLMKFKHKFHLKAHIVNKSSHNRRNVN